jgi:hypothetical protein
MLYLKKLALVAVLAAATLIWFPVLAVRGVFAVFNWLGAAMKSGMRHKDSGVMLVSFAGVIVFSPVWLLSMGMIIALAAYEVACFKLMNALYQAEDIGFRPAKGEPEPPPQRRVSQETRQEARVMQLPSAQRTLSEVQAQQVALRSGWNPHELDFIWDSRRQLWRSKDGQLVDHDGGHVAWAS